MEKLTVHREVLHDHVSQTGQLTERVGKQFVGSCCQKSVINRLSRGFLVHNLFEDLAIRVPQTTELVEPIMLPLNLLRAILRSHRMKLYFVMVNGGDLSLFVNDILS